MSESGRQQALSALAEALAGLTGTFNKGRNVLVQDSADGLEWPAHVLLRRLSELGPVRAASIAECLHLDKSTVSRQVAVLVRDGLLERQADPADGRASILVPTPAGHDVIADHEQHRLAFFDSMLAAWDDDELARFEELLTRFAADFNHAYEQWASDRARRAGHPDHHAAPAAEGASR